MKAREKRHPVRLAARMRLPGGWSDVQIRNVSAHGMLLVADEVPSRGSYLEVRRESVVIVARVVWHGGGKFGVRTQDAIDLKTLLTPPRSMPPAGDAVRAVERRHAPRGGAVTADRSRDWARRFQHAALLVAIAAGAAALYVAIADALAPLRTIEGHLLGE